MQIISAVSRQPLRITVATTGVPSIVATDYSLGRTDGGYSNASVRTAWRVGVNTVELALSEPLTARIIYAIAMPNDADHPSATLFYYQPASAAPPSLPAGEDPAAEAYGVSIDWLSGAMTGSGDLTLVKGRQCLLDDIEAIAVIEPGELYHRPDDGGGLPSDVNGPNIPQQQAAMRARLKRQWSKDERIASVDSINFASTVDGKVQLVANLTDAVSSKTVTANIPGGSG